MNKEIGDYLQRYLPRAHGWCSEEKGFALAKHVLENRPTMCVEIGVFAGRSLVAMALACRENSHGIVYGIDPWDPKASSEGFFDENKVWWNAVNHEEIFHHCGALVKIFDVIDFVRMIRATNRDALAQIPRGPIDLLHIDGNHSEESSVFDVENYVPRVILGGFVWFDDTDWNTTKKAQSILMKSCEKVNQVGTCAILRKK